MNTSARRRFGVALSVIPIVCGVLLQLTSFPLVILQSSTSPAARTVTAYYGVSWILMLLIVLSLAGLGLILWPGHEN